MSLIEVAKNGAPVFQERQSWALNSDKDKLMFGSTNNELVFKARRAIEPEPLALEHGQKLRSTRKFLDVLNYGHFTWK